MVKQVIDGLHASEYHAHPAIGSTSLKTLLEPGGPALYAWRREHPIHLDAFDIGTAAHSYILEDDESAFVVIDVEAKRGKAWTEPAEEARAEGRVPITSKEWGAVRGMRDAVRSHPVAGRLLDGHVAERSYFTELNGAAVKARADAIHEHHGIVLDLKTTASAAPSDLQRAVVNLGYDLSAAYYTDIIADVTGFAPAWAWVFVEKEPPHRVHVVEPGAEFMKRGREEYRRALDIYRECLASNEWPAFPETTTLTLPSWAK